MKKILILSVGVLTLLLAFAIAVGSAKAASEWNILGTYVVDFTLTADGTYPHTMNIDSMDLATGNFSGTGYYNADHSYTWTVTGKVTDSAVTFHILYTGSNAGYAIDATGVIAGDGSMSGTAIGPGQTFTWVTTSGNAVNNLGHLYLYQKTPTDPSWPIVQGGAWGKMEYNLSGPTFDFVFNGHNLLGSANYTLIYYPDPWPGTGLICLGTGTANKGKNVHIAGSLFTGNLPATYDTNKGGAKIWLVKSRNVDCINYKMIGWNPTEYLFENNLIKYDYTNWVLADTIEVPANLAVAVLSNITLETGKNYKLKAQGTACAEMNYPPVCTIYFDAEYGQNLNGATKEWMDGVEGYKGYRTDLLDLMVNGGFVDWGVYNSDHTYYQYVVGAGAPLSLMINDVYYPNNTGSLTVYIYKIN